MDLKEMIKEVPDFPKEGVVFRDITPILQDPKAFQYLIFQLAEEHKLKGIDLIAGVESMGFIIGAALANSLGKSFVPLRKAGRLPRNVITERFEKEHGKDTLQVHTDAIRQGQKVLVVDDVLATGGTAMAAARLVEKLGGRPEFCFVVALSALSGLEKLRNYETFTLIKY
jgi:adenine phosphoribosyltransferase